MRLLQRAGSRTEAGAFLFFPSRRKPSMKNVVLLACLTIFAMACSFATDPNKGPGATVWTAAGASFAAPAVADSTVYFATTDHALTALDSRSGVVRWRSPNGETRGLSLGSNVLIVGRLVIVPDLGLYGFDRVTGTRRWAFRPASGDTPGRFTISTDGARVFMGSAAGYAYGVDALTGVPVWINPLAVDGNSVVSHPVTDRGLVFVTLCHFTNPSTGGVVALDALTGAIRWQHDFVATGPGRGAGSYGRVGIWRDLVIAAADDGTVYALNRESGAVVWISPAGRRAEHQSGRRGLFIPPGAGIRHRGTHANTGLHEPRCGSGARRAFGHGSGSKCWVHCMRWPPS